MGGFFFHPDIRPTSAAYGADLQEWRKAVQSAQQIHNENNKSLLTAVADARSNGIPKEFALLGNYPNLFNPATIIRFAMPKAGVVTLRVYNLLGRQVATQSLGLQQPGEREVVFMPTNLSTGLYFYRLEMAEATTQRVRTTAPSKMLLTNERNG